MYNFYGDLNKDRLELRNRIHVTLQQNLGQGFDDHHDDDDVVEAQHEPT